MSKTARLMFGCGADNYYATGLEMHDPYPWYQDTAGKTHILMNALEVDRARRVAQVDEVHAMVDLKQRLEAVGEEPRLVNMLALLVADDGPDVIEVPFDFPAGLMVALQAKLGENPRLQPVKGAFFPARAVKTAAEIESIRAAQRINQQGFARGFAILHEADIAKDDALVWQDTPLTSEILQSEMNAEIVRHGGKEFGGGPIVAGGVQAADPHERGRGPLKAHEFIIIDSFPQGPDFYWGDLTRTVIKGQASQWHLDVYAAVRDAQQTGIDAIRAGVTGAEVEAAVRGLLDSRGFTTGVDEDGRNYGFFHSTGHSVGLDVHDDGPGLNGMNKEPLKAGMVVTVEPGVYYPGKGGCRIEDIVAVTDDGVDNLTTLEKELVIA